MVRKSLYSILWTITGAGCLSVQGCAQSGAQSVYQPALLSVAVGVVATEQCLEQTARALIETATSALGGRPRPTRELDKLHRFACPANGRVVLTLRHDNGTSCEIAMMKHGRTYTGPQGEHYVSIPSDEQLRLRYGLEQSPKYLTLKHGPSVQHMVWAPSNEEVTR